MVQNLRPSLSAGARVGTAAADWTAVSSVEYLLRRSVSVLARAHRGGYGATRVVRISSLGGPYLPSDILLAEGGG